MAWAIAVSSFCAISIALLPYPAVVLVAAIWGTFAMPGTGHPAGQTVNEVTLQYCNFNPPGRPLGSALRHAVAYQRSVFDQSGTGVFNACSGNLWRRLCGFGLFGSNRRSRTELEHRTANGGCFGPLRSHTRATDIGHTICGLFLAGYHAGGIGLALLAGLLALWVTFIPCFLWIFLFAPHLERLMSVAWLGRGLTGVTAAVVGVIASISI